MTLSEQLDKEYIEAYKAHESEKVGVLRLLKSAMKNRLVELKRPQGALSDQEVLDVILKQSKQRMDSIEQYNAAGRKDLADKEAGELAILRSWLPTPLTREELDAAVKDAIKKTGASSLKDMGTVIREIMADYSARVDGKQVSEAVKAALS